MSPKPKIERMPAPVRVHIQQRLRENRLSLNELLAEVQEQFPEHGCMFLSSCSCRSNA